MVFRFWFFVLCEEVDRGRGRVVGVERKIKI